MIRENLVKEYCCEDISLIQNYQKAIEDSTQTWQCHHRLEIEKKKQRVDWSKPHTDAEILAEIGLPEDFLEKE